MKPHHHAPRNGITRHDFIDRENPEDRVFVVVFLRGGADGLTLAPPVGDDAYARERPFLSVKKKDTIDLDGYFGLNIALRPLMQHYERGAMAIIHGAGSEDDTRSHFEAQDFMEHAGRDTGGGWLARYLRARGPSASALSAVAIGTTRPESLRGAPAGAVMQTLRDFSFGEDDPAFIDQLARLYAVEMGPLGQAAHDTIGAVSRLRQIRAQDNRPEHGAVYPENDFGRGLREIARLIKADVGLVTSTIDLNGWDTHFVQAPVIGGLMTTLASGIDAFLTDLGGLHKRVTVVTMTEFGRRLRENTSFGTDHGAGSVMMVFGEEVGTPELPAGVRSGWPDLSESNLDEVGDVPAAINFRDVLAPILVSHAPGLAIDSVFPGYTKV